MRRLARYVPVVIATLVVAGCSRESRPQAPAAGESKMKYGVPVKAGPMDALLVKDYAPASSLVTPETRVAKARYPAIDVHSHSSMNGIKTPADVDAWVRRMDEVGVEKSVVFTEAVGAAFDQQAELFLKRYPDRFQLWCGVDTSNIGAPDYGERAARELERCYRVGARGVGEITDKGWGVQGSEQGAQPRTARAFLERYKDRVLFGTDMGWERQMYEGLWRLLESADEYMPGRIWWRYHGLELPGGLLKSLFRDNALHLLNWTKP